MKSNVTSLNFLGIIEKLIRKIPIIYLLSRFLVRFTNYFEDDFHILKKIFKSKKINIIDVGASDGISAKFFINNLNCNKIYCFEPQATLSKKIYDLKKKFSNIKIYNYGIGKQDQEIINYYPSVNFLGKEYLLSTYSFAVKEELEMQIKSDFLIKTNITSRKINVKKFKIPDKKISLVKIDTNGSEYEIIQSMAKLIKRDLPIFIIENNNINLIYTFLKKYNYEKYVSENNQLELHKNQSNLNIIFKPLS